ncbi:MAG: S8 family serine peptidase [Deltaproteobacteria bacterium]|nr:S8 family serine peptidase [Deltaproteobacteria bacterium]
MSPLSRLLSLMLLLAAMWPAARPAQAHPPVASAASARIAGHLSEAVEAWRRGDAKDLERVARHARALIQGSRVDGRWRVQIEVPPGRRVDDLDLRDLADFGGEVAVLGLDLADVWLPLRAVEPWLARHPEVALAQLPQRPWPATGPTQSKGASDLRTSEVACLAADGSGTVVAVVDEGFDGLKEAVAAGEVPNVVGPVLSGDGAHGTMCCEVVADTAPGASIYPVKTGTVAAIQSFAKAVTEKGNPKGVQVVSHSVIWLGMSFGRLEGRLCVVTDVVRSAGVDWVNASGNSGGGKFYRAEFVDADGNGLHEFQPGVERLEFQSWHGQIQMTLDWDDYAERAVNLDLELWYQNDGTWQKVDESKLKQGKNIAPLEQVIYDVAAAGKYALQVRAKNGVPNGMKLRIVSMGYGNGALSVWHQNGNVYDPASCQGVLTVGAIYAGHYATGPLEGYSSYGPTPDDRQKPEVMAPTGVATTQGAFFGTSAACPHAAGVAAVWIAATGRTPADAVLDMRDTAAAMGESHPDAAYGWGRLVLDPAALGYECTATSLGADATCVTACGSVGTRTCGDGCQWNACQTGKETCNGQDDDCDGTTDRGPGGALLPGCGPSDAKIGSDGAGLDATGSAGTGDTAVSGTAVRGSGGCSSARAQESRNLAILAGILAVWFALRRSRAGRRSVT